MRFRSGPRLSQRLSVTIVAAVAVPAMLVAAPAASAGDDSGRPPASGQGFLGTGEKSQIVGTPGLSRQHLMDLAAKDARASAEYDRLMEVKDAVEAGDLAAAAEARAALRGTVASNAVAAGYEAQPNTCPDNDCSFALVTRISQVTQVNSHYCGPAALRSLVMGRISISQATASNRLCTTTDGTAWYGYCHGASRYVFEYALDYYLGPRGGANYVPIALDYNPTSTQKSQYRSRLTSDVNSGWGIAGDAWEVPGGYHLVGHPSSHEIFHWFSIRAYTNYGANTGYADSVHGASSIAWSGSVPAYSTMSSNTIVVIMGGRGYVW
jgi:hypothetical protein